jgi:hypothetical protein
MRYRATIEMPFLGDREMIGEVCAALFQAMSGEAGNASAGSVIPTGLAVTEGRAGNVILEVDLRGTSLRSLTSPLTAITKFDEWLNRSLIATGLFEEFDVSRRTLKCESG